MFNYICKTLKLKDISPPSFTLNDLFRNETNNKEPILFVVSSGSDPSRDIEELAEKTIGRERF